MDHDPSPRSSPQGLLTIFLTLLSALGILLFLIVVSQGYFLFVAVAVAGIAGLGYFHYWLWGRSLTEEVAAERAWAEAEAEDELPFDGPPGQRRF
jgi:hypothetical protein